MRTGSILYPLLSVLAYIAVATQEIGAQVVDSTAVDSLLIQELAREMGAPDVGEVPATAAPIRSKNLLNPEISILGDFRSRYDSEAERGVDLELHEVETALRSAIDPYARADFYVSIHGEDGEFAFELEEAYLTTLSLPYRLQLKAGKFRSAFGKINRIHPHALPYIDLPSVYRNFLGHEGLNDQGFSLSWLMPNRSFYQDLTVEVTRSPSEGHSFAIGESNRLLLAGRFKNFWDLSLDATLELGISGAAGPNDAAETTLLGGVDVTYIWKPVQYNVYRSVMLQAEAMLSRREEMAGRVIKTSGWYGLGQLRFARRWLATARFDQSDYPNDHQWDEQAVSITVGWLASEFQKVELGVKTVSANAVDRSYQALFRAVFVIGAHGAHEY